MLNKILCIDDDAITLMLCKKVITKAEISNEIDTALNGEDALKYLDNIIKIKHDDTNIVLPQLIFLDLNMPIMNGWEFLDIYHKKEYHKKFKTHFIILSSTIDPKDVQKSKSYPMVIDFLSKPITKIMLEELKGKY